MKLQTILLSATATLASCIGLVAQAQTVNSRCDIYPLGSDRVSKVVNCTFSQRQGFVRITREDGITYELKPTGNSPGNYIDQKGKAAYRQAGLGDRGQIYRLSNESVYIHWNERAQSPHPGSTASGRKYDATGSVRCSFGNTKHGSECDFGVLRGDSGSAVVYVKGPKGKERILNFNNGDVTTPERGARLTWGKQGDDWYIGINNYEYYIIPDAVILGG